MNAGDPCPPCRMGSKSGAPKRRGRDRACRLRYCQSIDSHRLYVGYEPLFNETALVREEVMIGFGAFHGRTTQDHSGCLRRSGAVAGPLAFPQATPTVLLAERTFWEKVTAVHVFFRQERRRGERLSCHWHDLARLDEASVAANAIGDRSLVLSVARHKAMFFSENDETGTRIDCEAAVSGDLQLEPAGGGPYLPMTMRGCLPMACCFMRTNLSMR